MNLKNTLKEIRKEVLMKHFSKYWNTNILCIHCGRDSGLHVQAGCSNLCIINYGINEDFCFKPPTNKIL